MATFSVISSHRIAARTGDLSGLSAGTLAGSYRWGNTAGYKARITSAEYGGIITTGFTAAQLVAFQLAVGRGVTSSHTGGTASTLTTPNTKLRAATDATRLTDFRVSTTVALGGGAGNLDNTRYGLASVWALAATAGASIFRDYDFTKSELGGLILERDEALVLESVIALGAAGTVQAYFAVSWDEGLVG